MDLDGSIFHISLKLWAKATEYTRRKRAFEAFGTHPSLGEFSKVTDKMSGEIERRRSLNCVDNEKIPQFELKLEGDGDGDK